MLSSNLLESTIKRIDTSLGLKGFPHITVNDKWQTTSDGDWTGGFWVGLLWSCYQLTRDGNYLRSAYRWLKHLEPRKGERNFDLWFLFHFSFVSGYQITEDESLKKVALEAADTLSNLFHEKAGFIYNVFHNPENVGVDESTIWGDYYFVKALNKVILNVGEEDQDYFNSQRDVR
jgi:rhamnogalacturonyl hydrolase YesR